MVIMTDQDADFVKRQIVELQKCVVRDFEQLCKRYEHIQKTADEIRNHKGDNTDMENAVFNIVAEPTLKRIDTLQSEAEEHYKGKMADIMRSLELLTLGSEE